MNTFPAQSRVLIVDDHQLILDGICSLLEETEEIAVVGKATDGQMAFDFIKNAPDSLDLVIADISMPLLNGLELCRMIKNNYPHIKVMILSMYSSNTAIKEALAAEADGYILKSTGKDELLKGLHRIAGGGTFFTQSIFPILYQQQKIEEEQSKKLSVLSSRELEILELILEELTSEEIGERLFISKKTVDNHRQNLLGKTGCKSTIGLVKFAIRNGMNPK